MESVCSRGALATALLGAPAGSMWVLSLLPEARLPHSREPVPVGMNMAMDCGSCSGLLPGGVLAEAWLGELRGWLPRPLELGLALLAAFCAQWSALAVDPHFQTPFVSTHPLSVSLLILLSQCFAERLALTCSRGALGK